MRAVGTPLVILCSSKGLLLRSRTARDNNCYKEVAPMEQNCGRQKAHKVA